MLQGRLCLDRALQFYVDVSQDVIHAVTPLFRLADSLPIQLFEKKKEMFLFDLQTLSFWDSKNGRSIADIYTSQKDPGEAKGRQASIAYWEGTGKGEQVHFCIRPEEIMILKEDRPIKKNLKANIFTGKIIRIVENRAGDTLFFKRSKDDYDFEIILSNLAY